MISIGGPMNITAAAKAHLAAFYWNNVTNTTTKSFKKNKKQQT